MPASEQRIGELRDKIFLQIREPSGTDVFKLSPPAHMPIKDFFEHYFRLQEKCGRDNVHLVVRKDVVDAEGLIKQGWEVSNALR